MNCSWKFSISFDARESQEATSIGISTRTLEDILEFSQIIELPCKVQTYKGNTTAVMEVCRDQHDKRLHKLLESIEVKYGFRPCPRRIVPRGDSATVFGVRRWRTYSDDEQKSANWLSIDFVDARIGEHLRGTIEQADADQYVANPRKVNKNVNLGFLSPFPRIAASDALKLHLESLSMHSLRFEPIVNLEGVLWKLSSEVVMPRSLVPLQDQLGADVAADIWTDQWATKYFDDGGCSPVELKYRRAEIDDLPPFDIAVTHEREGMRFSAQRLLVVTQRFRAALAAFKIKGVRYTPVRVVE